MNNIVRVARIRTPDRRAELSRQAGRGRHIPEHCARTVHCASETRRQPASGLKKLKKVSLGLEVDPALDERFGQHPTFTPRHSQLPQQIFICDFFFTAYLSPPLIAIGSRVISVRSIFHVLANVEAGLPGFWYESLHRTVKGL